MSDAAPAQTPNQPGVLTPKSGLSMGQQVMIALLLGITAGLFFGELTTKIKIIGDIYIGLLQMMVLPYIIIALIGGIGKLTLEQAKQIAKYAIMVLLLMWAVIGTVLVLLPLALPDLTSASFYSSSLVEPAKEVKLINIFIPKNFFASLSNNQIPAVVVFCIALGIALITSKEKQEVFKLFDVLAEAVMRVIKFVVSDNFNDLAEQGAGHYVVAYFDPNTDGEKISVEPLLSPEQVEAFRLFDLEGVTLIGDRLYAIGSLALHGKNPKRDRWERHQFLQMDLEEEGGRLRAVNLAHVTSRWPNFRDWLISKSGHEWTAEEVRGRAEGDGINVEALSATNDGNLLIGFRGPVTADGGTLALEIELPPTADDEPVLVKAHVLPALNSANIPKGAARTLRAISMVPGEVGHFYVLLGPKGYEKEELVLARWNLKTGELTKATVLPKNFVAEGVTPIPGNKVLVVDDLKEATLVATEY